MQGTTRHRRMFTPLRNYFRITKSGRTSDLADFPTGLARSGIRSPTSARRPAAILPTWLPTITAVRARLWWLRLVTGAFVFPEAGLALPLCAWPACYHSAGQERH